MERKIKSVKEEEKFLKPIIRKVEPELSPNQTLLTTYS